MKLKAKEIYDMYEAILSLSKEKTSMPTAYYIAKNTKIVKEEATEIDESRQKIIVEFAEKKEDGTLNTQENGMVKIPDDKLPAFTEQMNQLLNAEIEVAIRKIPLSSLTSINIPIDAVEVLLPIIDDDTNCEEAECQAEIKSTEVLMDTSGQIISME